MNATAIAAGLARETSAIAMTGEPATLRDHFGAPAYPMSLGCAMALRAARIGRTLADRLTVTDEHGEIEHVCTIGEMLRDNMHDSAVVLDVLNLAPGRSTLAGFSIITRESRR